LSDIQLPGGLNIDSLPPWRPAALSSARLSGRRVTCTLR
jgi:hypothetical protein